MKYHGSKHTVIYDIYIDCKPAFISVNRFHCGNPKLIHTFVTDWSQKYCTECTEAVGFILSTYILSSMYTKMLLI